MAKVSARGGGVYAELLEEVANALREGRKVNRKIGDIGKVFIDRQLPYLCVYRNDGSRQDWGTEHLILGESSYLTASGSEKDLEIVNKLVNVIATELGSLFGTFLVVEVWSGEEVQHTDNEPLGKADFQVFIPSGQPAVQYLHTLAKHLSLLELDGIYSGVSMVSARKIAPDGLKPVLSSRQQTDLNTHIIGLEVAPIYRDSSNGEEFPSVLERLQDRLTKVLERTFFDFLKTETTICPPNYLALGQRSIVQSVWQVDRMLSEVADIIDFLLLVTPTNAGQAQDEFRKSLYQRAPVFLYHPAPFNPIILKRQLWKTPIERIEDPTLAHLFREQLEDIDSRISMIAERGTRNFLYSSLKLYEKPDKSLVDLAKKILRKCHDPSGDESVHKLLSPKEFAKMAEDELEYYRSVCPDLKAKVHIRQDVPGVLVSGGDLLIGADRRVSRRRAYALISHEVGTHILTNYNGKKQRFTQLSAGLPGYDELQESLAVMGEYLVDGLTGGRLRTLAARVMCVHWMVDGADFVEVYRNLTKDYDFNPHVAFTITMRVFRSGGFTKDVVYLRGLTKLVEQIKNGLQLELIFTGKFGLEHLPIVRELMYRKILVEPQVMPRYVKDPSFDERLQKIRDGLSILEMVSE